MRWLKVDDYCIVSEDKRWTITKANVTGWLCYCLYDYGTKDERGNPRCVEIFRGIPPHDNAARLDAINKLKRLADGTQAGVE